MKQTPIFEENIGETLDVRVLLDKVIAADVCKTWQETFKDEKTGEAVIIERNALLFERGTLVDKDEASSIQFSIDAGDITKPIKYTTNKRLGIHNQRNGYRPIFLKMSHNGLKTIGVLLWADTYDHAEIVAADYIEQITDTYFTIFDIKDINAEIVDTPEAYKYQDKRIEEVDITINPFPYYQVSVSWKESGTPYPFVGGTKKAKEHLRSEIFICQAEDFESAKAIVSPVISKIAYKEDRWTKIDLHWDKGAPYQSSIIVPKEFCDKYNEHFQSLNK